MNRELKRVSTVVLLMFVSLFISSSVIQVVTADSLQADGRNVRTLYASYSAERGPILVNGEPIALSQPADDEFKFLRVYPQGELYAPITGYLTLNQGNTGIESALNDYLSGSSNDQFFDQVNAILTGQKPTGAAVELTIDPVIQQAAWDALGDYTGAVVAIKPKTGEIIAMVSKPTFDPNELAVHNTGAVIDTYERLLNDPSEPLFNRTLAGPLNPPGSTFKLVAAAAALESGNYTAESAFPNPAELQLPESTFKISNANSGTCGPGNTATIATAVRLSCNIPMAELGDALGASVIREQANKFGFNESVSVPLESTPSVYPRALDRPQTMLSAFGQSSVRASPLQMAMVSMAIANSGTLMQPNLVESVVASDLTTIQSFEPTVFSQAISPQTAAALTAIMVAGVNNGAASSARIDGVEVAGKTGTAENGQGEPYTLWFTGFAPANDPEVVVAVVVEDGGGLGQSGTSSGISAPIGRQVLEAVLNK
ncbi:cell elongation-specific peptidoglycan D,D-transpeptidase [Rhodoglobus vestalii]|uniref:Cell elongation-specific peptidoglycan D,D-transpeptidase n=1 Tax=Rhodoglobus vestalii TaxID=193384 RepID=A0A8H2K700_9MICO|nr:penicillin-binding transpeptidase domain-containing protein [Rhodoglobus vestalii]TQO19983.1 cell elongation-specific peptidoglycan D,D-transpeptidase [Rhodoglobus vestalii]